MREKTELTNYAASLIHFNITKGKIDYATPWREGLVFSYAIGSGFVIEFDKTHPDYHHVFNFHHDSKVILTNFHVIENAKDIRFSVGSDETHTKYSAKVITFSDECDLALLEVIHSETQDMTGWKQTKPLSISNEQPKRDAQVTLLGHPSGAASVSQTSGTISRIDEEKMSGITIQILQTTASTTYGGSGGPAIDPVSHKVIGVQYAAHQTLSITYLIPSTRINYFLNNLQQNGCQPSELPVVTFNYELMENYVSRNYWGMENKGELSTKMTGIQVTNIASTHSSAYGLLKKNDIILAINEYTISNDGKAHYYENIINSLLIFNFYKPHDTVRLKILRNKKIIYVYIPLYEKKNDVIWSTWEREIIPLPFVYRSGLIVHPVTENSQTTNIKGLGKTHLLPQKKHPSNKLIIIREMLQHPTYTSGIDCFRHIIRRVNGDCVYDIYSLMRAFDSNKTDYHMINTYEEKDILLLNLEREEYKKENKNLMEKYSFPKMQSSLCDTFSFLINIATSEIPAILRLAVIHKTIFCNLKILWLMDDQNMTESVVKWSNTRSLGATLFTCEAKKNWTAHIIVDIEPGNTRVIQTISISLPEISSTTNTPICRYAVEFYNFLTLTTEKNFDQNKRRLLSLFELSKNFFSPSSTSLSKKETNLTLFFSYINFFKPLPLRSFDEDRIAFKYKKSLLESGEHNIAGIVTEFLGKVEGAEFKL